MAALESCPTPKRLKILTSIKENCQEAMQRLLTIQRYNIQTLRSQPLSEISGSLGDLGTLLPLLISLTHTHSISLPSTLVFSGAANILTGILFGIPLPVQPMKAIAAVAIARSFTTTETASAGLFVAGAIGLLSATGLVRWFTSVVPVPVVKGIQVGTGLSLVGSAGRMYPGNGSLNWLVLLLAFLALLGSSTFRRVPYALIVFSIGVIAAAVWNSNALFPGPNIWRPRTYVPSSQDFRVGVLEAGIGQLPLTTLNSVIAVAFLAEDLLPDIRTPSTTALGLSVAAINLVGCWFGAMPVCHGSGGLAAQFRFGARSGASVIILGMMKFLLGLFASDIAMSIFHGFPNTLLCILLIAAGLELVKVGESLNTAGAKDWSQLRRGIADREGFGQGERDKEEILNDEKRKRRWAVMFITVAGILAFHNDAVGFLAGMLCHWSFLLEDYWIERRSQQGGKIRLGHGNAEQDGPS